MLLLVNFLFDKFWGFLREKVEEDFWGGFLQQVTFVIPLLTVNQLVVKGNTFQIYLPVQLIAWNFRKQEVGKSCFCSQYFNSVVLFWDVGWFLCHWTSRFLTYKESIAFCRYRVVRRVEGNDVCEMFSIVLDLFAASGVVMIMIIYKCSQTCSFDIRMIASNRGQWKSTRLSTEAFWR